ncbi:complex I NDUFA9 subunit family protein [Halomonas sp. YLGW01]|uniref:complex I NDUFA9 subunit family protein n=1 Tax=Halomonas sp. YLGW01 TaxID=2773308 RepID=UPI00177E94CC|nr:complex I NDUFA9 subunit family protein [Halomonas sp. YLGW01]
MPDGPITVFGGTGFLGRAIVRELLEAGHAVRIVARTPRLPGGIDDGDPLSLSSADIRDDDSVREALAGASGAVNAVSLYVESRRLSFDAIHVEGAGRLARLAREAGITRLVHVSGIGVDEHSTSRYISARARGEAAVLRAFPKASLLRPSVLFGPGDAFLSTLETLTRLPAIPLFGRGETRLQPVHVGDVARAVGNIMGPRPPAWRLFELGGEDVMRYRDILTLVMAHLRREHPLVPVPWPVWHALATLFSPLPRPPLTHDQLALLAQDNIVGEGVGTFTDLGIIPRSLRDSLPNCLSGS